MRGLVNPLQIERYSPSSRCLQRRHFTTPSTFLLAAPHREQNPHDRAGSTRIVTVRDAP